MRIALASVVVLGLCRLATAAPCGLDRTRYRSLAGTGGFGEGLVCNGHRLDDVWARFAADGSITGIHWAEYQGEHLKRTIQVYDSGQVAFIVEDRSVKGGFWAQSRGSSQYVFPRGGRMTVEAEDDRHLVVRDGAGHVWQLVATPVAGSGSPRVSYVVAAVDDAPQRPVPIGFAVRAIIGVDLAATQTLYLDQKQPSQSGISNRRSPRYRKTRSVFHDPRGQTCAVPNAELFVPNPSDPDDKADNAFRFDDDAALAAFLAKACPKLDVSSLGAAVGSPRWATPAIAR